MDEKKKAEILQRVAEWLDDPGGVGEVRLETVLVPGNNGTRRVTRMTAVQLVGQFVEDAGPKIVIPRPHLKVPT